MKKLDEQMDRRLEEAAALDAEEDKRYGKGRRGDELPEALKDPKMRAERLREAERQLEAEKTLELAVEKERRREKIRKAREDLKSKAREKAEVQGENPEEAKPSEKASAQLHRLGVENHASGRLLPAVLQHADGDGSG